MFGSKFRGMEPDLNLTWHLEPGTGNLWLFEPLQYPLPSFVYIPR